MQLTCEEIHSTYKGQHAPVLFLHQPPLICRSENGVFRLRAIVECGQDVAGDDDEIVNFLLGRHRLELQRGARGETYADIRRGEP